MTERLYYNDSYLREFDARVLACAPAQQAGRWQVTLERTAFYPTSGGQPFDTGVLGTARVLEVVDGEAESIVHVTDAALGEGEVRGAIDWPRRFDHMQQHTGQHILSAAFVERCAFPTVSFHLGRYSCTIDLPQTPSAAQLEAAEERANQVVFENRPVEVMYGTAAELEKIGVRKAVEREGVLRAVHIRDFDLQPCGGTHVAHTAEVGMILLRKIEKQKQNCRIEFVCGGRALRVGRADYAALTEAARLLSCAPNEVSAGMRRALEERQASSKRLQSALEALATLEAAALLGTLPADGPRCIVRVFEEAEPAYLRLLATRLVASPGVQVFVATRAGGHVVFAQSPGLAGDMNQLLRATLQTAGGKGGGSRDFAQGAVPDETQLEALLQNVAKQLT